MLITAWSFVAAVLYEIRHTCFIKDWGWNKPQLSHELTTAANINVEGEKTEFTSCQHVSIATGVFKYCLNYSFCLPMQLINIFCFKLGYFLYPKVSYVSPSVASPPVWEAYSSSHWYFFPLKWKMILCICIPIAQNFSLSVCYYSVYYQSFLG